MPITVFPWSSASLCHSCVAGRITMQSTRKRPPVANMSAAVDEIGEWIGCTWASPTTASDRPNRQARLQTAQIVYLQSASLLLGISQSYSSVRLVNRNAVSAPRKTTRPFPAKAKLRILPDLERIFVIGMSRSHRAPVAHRASAITHRRPHSAQRCWRRWCCSPSC